MGDRNNAYFHSIVKDKNKQKGITTLESLNGQLLCIHVDIEQAVLTFYTSPVGTSARNLAGIDISALRNGSILPVDMAHSLIQPMEEKEIWAALQSIGSTKAPGIDGFNACFSSLHGP